ERRRRRPRAARGDLLAERRDVGLARHLRADEPDRPAQGEPALDLGAQRIRAPIADGPIHEARRAEAAAPLAAAARLDDEHVAEDGLRREDLRPRREGVESLDVAADDATVAGAVVLERGEAAAGVVARRVA